MEAAFRRTGSISNASSRSISRLSSHWNRAVSFDTSQGNFSYGLEASRRNREGKREANESAFIPGNAYTARGLAPRVASYILAFRDGRGIVMLHRNSWNFGRRFAAKETRSKNGRATELIGDSSP